jgi:hypothetical protein
VRIQLAATPLATLMQEMPSEQQAVLAEALIADVSETLRPYICDDGLVFPQECHTLSAYSGGR